MKVLIMMDSFKESLTSAEANKIIKEELLKLMPDSSITTINLSDGGDGMLDCFRDGSKVVTTKILDPLEKEIKAEYLIKDKVAYIESAKAVGLALIPKEKRNPLKATSRGLGILIKDAIKKGIRNFVIGLGGTATNDGGAGMLCELGFRFLDEHDNPIDLNPTGLLKLARIDATSYLKELKDCKFTVLSDVNNPLLGENGASYIFGPQKGATLPMLKTLDTALAMLDFKTKEINNTVKSDYPSCGAAGGLGYAFKYYLNSDNLSGINYIIEENKLDELIASSDLIITGEGKFDETSLNGKAPTGILKLANKYDKPTALICGEIEAKLNLFTYEYSLNDSTLSLDENIKNTKHNLKKVIKKLVSDLASKNVN